MCNLITSESILYSILNFNTMDIILLEDVDKVGDKYDLVTVKNGFGRNYLIPQKLALIANETNRKRLADLKRREAASEAKKLDVYQEIATQLEGKTLKIGAKAGTSGKIFGSVNSLQISQAIKEQFNLDVDKKKIHLTEEVKNIGAYVADLKLHAEVETKLNFEVVAE